jgi:prepilin-type N-terminal cleavage/methylation domain-containing protein
VSAAHGFSLIEVVVAIGLLSSVVVAIGPVMVNTVRADGHAKLDARAKGVLQGQLDAMRNLPFHVDPSAGDHVDLLDSYFRNLAGPAATASCGTSGRPGAPQSTWSGYVPSSSAARCWYEPAGAMYRTVLPGGTAAVPSGFALVIDTQFVSATVPSSLVTPIAAFNTQVSGKDRPPAPQVRVTGTVMYSDRGRWRPVTAATQIAQRVPLAPQIKLQADATVLNVGSAEMVGTQSVSLTAGQLHLAGSLYDASEADASLTAVSGANSVTGRQTGAALAVTAPYSNLITLNTGSGGLGFGCDDSCWGATAIPPFVVAADNGLPRAGVQGLGALLGPVQTMLPDNVTRDGFQFRNDGTTLPGLGSVIASMDATALPGELLHALGSVTNGCAFNVAGAGSHLGAAGYLNSTDDTNLFYPDRVDACAGGRTDVVRILPTATAPDGLVRITARSVAQCTVTTVGHTPSAAADYRAEVEYWKWTPGLVIAGIGLPGSGHYVSAGVITPTTTVDPLAAVPLTTMVSDSSTLGDYIDSWSGVTAADVIQSATGHIAQVTVPALVSIQTQPVRGVGDPSSAVTLAVGSASCYAEDNR